MAVGVLGVSGLFALSPVAVESPCVEGLAIIQLLEIMEGTAMEMRPKSRHAQKYHVRVSSDLTLISLSYIVNAVTIGVCISTLYG